MTSWWGGMASSPATNTSGEMSPGYCCTVTLPGIGCIIQTTRCSFPCRTSTSRPSPLGQT